MPKKVIKKIPQKTAKEKKKAKREKKPNNLQKQPHLRVFQGIDIGAQGLICDYIIASQTLAHILLQTNQVSQTPRLQTPGGFKVQASRVKSKCFASNP